MTLIRCLAVLYSYYQFRNLRKMGSKYILGKFKKFTLKIIKDVPTIDLRILLFLKIGVLHLETLLIDFTLHMTYPRKVY